MSCKHYAGIIGSIGGWCMRSYNPQSLATYSCLYYRAQSTVLGPLPLAEAHYEHPIYLTRLKNIRYIAVFCEDAGDHLEEVPRPEISNPSRASVQA